MIVNRFVLLNFLSKYDFGVFKKNHYVNLWLVSIISCIKRCCLSFLFFVETIHVILIKRYIIMFLNFLKKSILLRLNFLSDLWGVDYLFFKNRFGVYYNLVSLLNNLRVIAVVFTTGRLPLKSITKCYDQASWGEREVWDMFGISFTGLVDMRRILTDYNFFGHPLRKDFPVVGFMEVSYDFKKGLLFYHKVSLAQEMRIVRMDSVW